MTDEIERIVRGLSEAQREDVLKADSQDPYCERFGRLYFSDSAHALVDAYPAHDDPSATSDENGGTRWSWNTLGLQVRARLGEGA